MTQITRRAGSRRTGRRDREARDGLGRGRRGDRGGRRTAAGWSEDEPPGLSRNLRLPPKSALSRSPPVPGADREGQQGVDMTRSASRPRTTGICGKRTAGVRRRADVEERGLGRLNWADGTPRSAPREGRESGRKRSLNCGSTASPAVRPAQGGAVRIARDENEQSSFH